MNEFNISFMQLLSCTIYMASETGRHGYKQTHRGLSFIIMIMCISGALILHNSPIIIGEKFPYFQDLGKSLPIFSDVVKFPFLNWGRKLVMGEILKA